MYQYFGIGRDISYFVKSHSQYNNNNKQDESIPMVRLFEGQHICPVWWKSVSTDDLYSIWYNWCSATRFLDAYEVILTGFFICALMLANQMWSCTITYCCREVIQCWSTHSKAIKEWQRHNVTRFNCTHNNITTISYVKPRPRWRDVLTGTPPKNIDWLLPYNKIFTIRI